MREEEPRRISGPERNEIIGRRRKLQKKELQNFALKQILLENVTRTRDIMNVNQNYDQET
jgi:hypothetical protein